MVDGSYLVLQGCDLVFSAVNLMLHQKLVGLNVSFLIFIGFNKLVCLRVESVDLFVLKVVLNFSLYYGCHNLVNSLDACILLNLVECIFYHLHISDVLLILFLLLDVDDLNFS